MLVESQIAVSLASTGVAVGGRREPGDALLSSRAQRENTRDTLDAQERLSAAQERALHERSHAQDLRDKRAEPYLALNKWVDRLLEALDELDEVALTSHLCSPSLRGAQVKRSCVVVWLAGVGLMGAVMVECGAVSNGTGTSGSASKSTGPSAPPSAVSDDPKLSAAAGEVDAIVRPRYEDWYASTVLDHRGGVLTVYRKPPSDLDRDVRARVPGVELVFQDAAMSEKTMPALPQEILADTEYWRERDIVITGGGPLSDGSGVEIMTQAGKDAEATRLSNHYDSRVVVERSTAAGGPAGEFTPSPQSPE